MKEVSVEKIISFLKTIQASGDLEADTLLFECGYLDSLIIFERLLPELEESYGIKIHPQDLIPDNFESPEKIFRYVKSRTGQERGEE